MFKLFYTIRARRRSEGAPIPPIRNCSVVTASSVGPVPHSMIRDRAATSTASSGSGAASFYAVMDVERVSVAHRAVR